MRDEYSMAGRIQVSCFIVIHNAPAGTEENSMARTRHAQTLRRLPAFARFCLPSPRQIKRTGAKRSNQPVTRPHSYNQTSRKTRKAKNRKPCGLSELCERKKNLQWQ